MQVLKFGGSSLADSANMLKAADIIAKAVDRDRTIVIASAIFGCTDTLQLCVTAHTPGFWTNSRAGITT